ncbi:MAG: acyl-CoA reductase, partial [Vulcanimicrobiaceae bacterium]
RVTSAIAARTGYSLPVGEFALDRLFRPLQAREIERVIADELGSVDALDRFVEHEGSSRRAFPLGRVVIVSSQTTIGVALLPAIYALCAKCTVLVKDREDALISAFFQTLTEEMPELAAFAQARTWKAGDAQNDRDLLLADGLVAFGRDQTLATLRAALRPNARFIGYGHRASVGYVAHTALTNESDARAAARGAARDLVLYDGEGCMSLHALFVERGGAVEPRRFTELLIEAVAEASVEFPPGRLDPRIATYCTGATFRAALGRGSVLRTPDASATVVVDPPLGEAPPFLPRILPLYVVDEPQECEEYVRSHGLPLEAFAVAQPNERLAELAAALGAVRIPLLGEMQAPSPALHHGGRSRIADFIRWVDA